MLIYTTHVGLVFSDELRAWFSRYRTALLSAGDRRYISAGVGREEVHRLVVHPAQSDQTWVCF